ncbi:serine-rich adhesin for platelets isoform X2 [Musca domestica]|uniref:Serine-rich adhesin for platelets isoform X2 n=1 Tax=Musca domestica TaxID=7370 RepID=A0ABM3UXR3_MUSDO|nr:serine-rich adhesin for platelets isoform X2 [Musca domestica]
MAAIPLTLDILASPTRSPLVSPQILAMPESSQINERPSVLALANGSPQHSKVSPSHLGGGAGGSISPVISSLTPSFLPEMPQWKRDLIQRRKQNVQRTISASSPQNPAASPSIASSPSSMVVGGLRNSTSSSSMRSFAGSNGSIDQLASEGLHSPTKDFNKSSSSPSSSSTSTSTTKVNKQHATTSIPAAIKSPSAAAAATPPTTTTKLTSPLTITSPHKELATAKLFGGQYTAITEAPTTTATATVNTKEEITTTKDPATTTATMEEEYLEKTNKTKETTKGRTIRTSLGGEEDDGGADVHNNITTTSGIKQQQQQQMATRLTGSSSSSSSVSSLSSSTMNSGSATTTTLIKRAELLSSSCAERETATNININITGANNGSANQSSSKCESERLVCAANNSGLTSVSTTTATTTTNTVVKISQKLQENQFIKNEQQVVNKTKIIKTIKTADSKSPTKTVSSLTSTSSSSTSSSFASSTNSNCAAIKKKMVAMQEMKKSTQNSATHLQHSTCSATNNGGSSVTSNGRSNRIGVGGGHGVIGGSQNSNDLDSNEDLSYGPGIVSKLRCRYLSLALRESMEQQRLNKDLLRRSTSLNNLLDDDRAEDEEEEEDEDDDENIENIDVGAGHAGGDQQQNTISGFAQKKSGILKNSYSPQEKRFSQGSNGVGVTFTETSSFNKRSRHLKRGNDSLKRARSVEALLSEKSPWQGQRMAASVTPTCVTIEDKIQNARERLHQGTDHMPPKRLTSIIDDTERPPPDLVKQTLKMFEANANRRPRSTNRSNSKGDVASKVETFKNIIKDQKPVVSYPKPLSPTKKLGVGGTPNLVKPTLKSSSELQQTPLGRKTMAAANSHASGLESKTNTLSEHTPDIIPRQKLHSERDQHNNKEKYSMGINKEKFMNSLMEPPLSTVVDSPLKSSAKDRFLASMVDSPVTALSKELERMKLSDNSNSPQATAGGKGDNSKSDNMARRVEGDGSEASGSVGGIGISSGGGGGDRVGVDDNRKVDDAFHDGVHGDDDDNQYNQTGEQEEAAAANTNEFSTSSLKSENDKIKQQQIHNETAPQSNSNNVSAFAAAGQVVPSQATNEAAVKKAHSAHSSSDLSDGEDDDEYGIPTTKRITRAALDNIAKAGTTQQFKFSSNASSTASPAQSQSANNNNSSSTTTSVAGKQIGVIRPLQNTTATATTTTAATNATSNNSSSSNMEALKHSSVTPSHLTSREIEKNRINDLKKSTGVTSSSPSSNATLPSSASLDVIKSSSSHNTTTANSGGTAASGSGFSEVDTVISATNSPLWAMRKRRQNPPAPPAEQTSMVFNFSNRKEVPDYIENDGVIFRRKRELPKPNESGFVLLGDLSVETSTDLDYDDFSMCPPSPCDVEFVNANIVIDGKSSIRQKPKDATFRVQFNDTLTSTFEYPSEASLIVDDSFSSVSGETELNQTFQNLVLENSIPLHHVADEIIQLPTTNESTNSPANTTATKNILGNLPLDCPDLEKATALTMTLEEQPTQDNREQEQQLQDQCNNNNLNNSSSNNNNHMEELPQPLEMRKSRKDLKLPLLEQQHQVVMSQKPPLPVKSSRMKTWKPPPSYLKANIGRDKTLVEPAPAPPPTVTPLTPQPAMSTQQDPPNIVAQHQVMITQTQDKHDSNGNSLEDKQITEEKPKERPRKMPQILSHPKYACFLQPNTADAERPMIQRSRSNEFRRNFNANPVTLPVFRSNSLRNIEKPLPMNSESKNTITTSIYFDTNVNSSNNSNQTTRNANNNATTAMILPPDGQVDDLKSTAPINLTIHRLDNTKDMIMDEDDEFSALNEGETSLQASTLSLPSAHDLSGFQETISCPNITQSDSCELLLNSNSIVDRSVSLQNINFSKSEESFVSSSPMDQDQEPFPIKIVNQNYFSLPNLIQTPKYIPHKEAKEETMQNLMEEPLTSKSMENLGFIGETIPKMSSKSLEYLNFPSGPTSRDGQTDSPSQRPHIRELIQMSGDSVDDVYEDALCLSLDSSISSEKTSKECSEFTNDYSMSSANSNEYSYDLVINEIAAKDYNLENINTCPTRTQLASQVEISRKIILDSLNRGLDNTKNLPEENKDLASMESDVKENNGKNQDENQNPTQDDITSYKNITNVSKNLPNKNFDSVDCQMLESSIVAKREVSSGTSTARSEEECSNLDSNTNIFNESTSSKVAVSKSSKIPYKTDGQLAAPLGFNISNIEFSRSADSIAYQYEHKYCSSTNEDNHSADKSKYETKMKVNLGEDNLSQESMNNHQRVDGNSSHCLAEIRNTKTEKDSLKKIPQISNEIFSNPSKIPDASIAHDDVFKQNKSFTSGQNKNKQLHIKTNDKFYSNLAKQKPFTDTNSYTTYSLARKCNRSNSQSFAKALSLYESFSEKSSSCNVVRKETKNVAAINRSVSMVEGSRNYDSEIKGNSKKLDFSASKQTSHTDRSNFKAFGPSYELQTATIDNSLLLGPKADLKGKNLVSNSLSSVVFESKTVSDNTNSSLFGFKEMPERAMSPILLNSNKNYFNISPRPYRRNSEHTFNTIHNTTDLNTISLDSDSFRYNTNHLKITPPIQHDMGLKTRTNSEIALPPSRATDNTCNTHSINSSININTNHVQQHQVEVDIPKRNI